MSDGEKEGFVDLYGSNYSRFASALYEEIRREAFGEDLGSNSWLTPRECEAFSARLGIGPDSRLLDVGCGPGGPVLRIARERGCEAVGIDLNEQALAHGRMEAARAGLDGRIRFERRNAGEPLDFPSESFDAILCIDAINHLPDRALVLSEWRRVLSPGGRALFTDPVVVTGPMSEGETAIRSSIGFYLFLPDGENEKLLESAGLDLVSKEDATASVEWVARRRREARQARAVGLREIEGEASFEGQQKFLLACEELARARRLSRFVYLVEKRGDEGKETRAGESRG